MKPILVISHERSGTHFLINTIALNFGLSNKVINFPVGEPTVAALALGSFHPEKIRKSHHQAHWFGEFVSDILNAYNVFFVIRDCRGVMVSLYHYFQNVSTFNQTFPVFDRLTSLIDARPSDYRFDSDYSLVKAQNFPERWAIHIDSWQSFFPDMCVVTYKELSTQHTATVWKIAAHLNRLPAEPIQQPRLGEMYSVSPYRGVLNAWKEEMTQRDSSRVCRMVQRHERWLTD